ncbi:STAS domain-containing protein [Roseicyclus sp. F158]|uniref:STAS domain-containing protein n=1 Tax=Tropicimonas omnivorans TaxID=3075590 RepID=A0ABU3DKW6_9RHOB|nr:MULTISPECIES: STAS domain-containing protein [Roseobacteraceae]MDT0684360.1 STAS domain-containing protein [Roseicyclus sp. F158]
MSGVASIHLVENALLVSIQDDVTDTEIIDLQDALSNRIADENVDGVIVDISALEIVDTFVGRVIAQLAGISRLLAAETYVVGMRPAVAVTLVELGMYLPQTRTALSLSHALAQLRRG